MESGKWHPIYPSIHPFRPLHRYRPVSAILASRLHAPSSIPSFLILPNCLASKAKLFSQALQLSLRKHMPARKAVEAPDAPRDAMWEVERAGRAQPQGQRPIPATQTSPGLAHPIPRNKRETLTSGRTLSRGSSSGAVVQGQWSGARHAALIYSGCNFLAPDASAVAEAPAEAS